MAGVISCQALTLLCKALTQLEVGELCIAAFGKELNVLHPLASPFTTESGASAMGEFTLAGGRAGLVCPCPRPPTVHCTHIQTSTPP